MKFTTGQYLSTGSSLRRVKTCITLFQLSSYRVFVTWTNMQQPGSYWREFPMLLISVLCLHRDLWTIKPQYLIVLETFRERSRKSIEQLRYCGFQMNRSNPQKAGRKRYNPEPCGGAGHASRTTSPCTSRPWQQLPAMHTSPDSRLEYGNTFCWIITCKYSKQYQ